jgi:tRNA dimethylallyltransferase
MDQIICVVGSTATGKTKKALELASTHPSILVSADSRQVFKGMDIVPGKDHPKDVSVYGIDLVEPDEACSVSVWYDAVAPHISAAIDTGKQVIVVGGTGLYIKAITDGIETMSVPLDQNLREKLGSFTVLELQDKLKKLDTTKFESMNHSDQLNPRRLIRAIEVATNGQSLHKIDLGKATPKIIGLKYIDSNLQKEKIHARVLSRLELGAIAETQTLLKKYNRDLQSMSALGYRSIIKYLDNELSKDEMIESWVHDEMAYVKRQMTWFHKVPVIWYDVDTI